MQMKPFTERHFSLYTCRSKYPRIKSSLIAQQKHPGNYLKNTHVRDGFYAGYGIRTRELLRDRILSPAPLASLANPAPISEIYAAHIVFIETLDYFGHLACILLE